MVNIGSIFNPIPIAKSVGGALNSLPGPLNPIQGAKDIGGALGIANNGLGNAAGAVGRVLAPLNPINIVHDINNLGSSSSATPSVVTPYSSASASQNIFDNPPSNIGNMIQTNPNPTVGLGFNQPPTAPSATGPTLDQQWQDIYNLAKNSQYTPASSSGGGSSIVDVGPSLQNILSMTGLDKGYTAPTQQSLQSQALNNVNLQMSPELAQYQTQINESNAQYNQARNAEQTTGAQQQADDASTYQRLQSFINAAQTAGNSNFDQAATAQSGDYGNLLAGIQQNYNNGKSAVTAEQARLGLTGINNSALDRDAMFTNGLAQNNQAAAANALAGQRANFNGTEGMLGSSEQASGAAAQSKLGLEIQSALSNLALGNQNNVQSIQDKANNLAASKSGLVNQDYQTLQNQSLTNQDAYTKSLLAAIAAANAGEKTVTNATTHTAASGLDPLQALQEMGLSLNGQRSDQTAASSEQSKAVAQQIQQQNLALAIQRATAAGANAIGTPPALASQYSASSMNQLNRLIKQNGF